MEDRNEHAEDRDILEIVNSIEGKAAGSLRVLGEQPCTIYRVSKVLGPVNEKHYEPQFVSIGPFHRGKERLKPMEEKKSQYLLALLSRNPELKLEDFVKEIKKLEADARSCYSESISLKSKEFVEMMVFDGCFFVEMFLRIDPTNMNDDSWLPRFISSDMLLLENQLPFFVLERIFSLVELKKRPGFMKDLLDCFEFIYVMPLNKEAAIKESYHHVLDIFHHHCLPKHYADMDMKGRPDPDPNAALFEADTDIEAQYNADQGRLFTIPSAEELLESGIKLIKKAETTGSFLDVEFDKKGVLKIPFLYFSDNLQTLVQNLIAYEQCYPKVGTFFTGYALFMDDLINTTKDVRILRHAGILEHGLGSDEELIQLVNRWSKGIFYHAKDTHLYRERIDLQRYSSIVLEMKHKYKSNHSNSLSWEEEREERKVEVSSMEEIKESKDGDDAIEHTEELVILRIVNSIEGKAAGSRRVPCEQPCTIYQVPKVLRQVNAKSYEPQLASIGPYHHGKNELKPMEGKKSQYVLALLSRNPELKLEDLVKEIKKSEAEARKCYSESIRLESKEFVEMMVCDGCFLVEIILRIPTAKTSNELWSPFFKSHDMLLLENQLPFFILQRIFSLVTRIETADLLTKFLLACWCCCNNFALNADVTIEESYHHVLDMFHHHCLRKQDPDVEPKSSTNPNADPPTTSEGRKFSIPSAEELQEAGIKFQRKEAKRTETGSSSGVELLKETGSFLDVEFDQKGVLKIPFLYFPDNMQTIFQNLIAYEKCYPKVGAFFTGYALFMDDLVNTAKDVRILCHAGIIEHGLGSNDEVAQSFNELCKQIFYDSETIHLATERTAINDYCQKRWPRWRAKLMRNYFNSPWAIVSLIAAVLLLLLTITQTVFSILPNV